MRSKASFVDAIQPVSGAEALRLARELARQEGIFCGISGGATLAAALEVAKTAPKGSRILFMVPDTGERYLSTPLFEAIGQEMDAEELAISNSTPLGRFGAPPAKPAAAPLAPVEPAPARARDFVAEVLADPKQPVVMFALEWCEFCWAVRRFLKDMGVPFRSVDLDAVAMQTERPRRRHPQGAAALAPASQRSRRSSSAAYMSAARSTSWRNTTAANWSRCCARLGSCRPAVQH